MASGVDFSAWFDEGVNQGATHLLVVWDGNELNHYPVYVKPNEKSRIKVIEYNTKPKQRVTEVFNLAKNKEAQMNENRAFNH
jgi:hypothetical protein